MSAEERAHWEARDDKETLEHLQSRWGARPTGDGVLFDRTAQRLGLTSVVERTALQASLGRLIDRGLVEKVTTPDRTRYRLTPAGGAPRE